MENLNSRFETLCDEQDKLYKPKFEAIFKALFSVDEGQKEIYKTSFWDMGITLPDKPDIDKIKQAINKAGFGADKALYNDFVRYAQIVIDGKRIQQEKANEAMAQRKEAVNQNEWQFVQFKIIAPEPIMNSFKRLIEADAKAGKGLFANVTNIPEENEAFDELLMIDQYGLKGSLSQFYDELIKYNVIGDNGFLRKDLDIGLFKEINKIVSFIIDNTNKPIKIKNHIKKEITKLDNIPVWGLFLQILILCGVYKWIEEININEGDNGFNETQSLFNWVGEKLAFKEAVFCHTPYGDEDKQLLKPFCNYLYSTELGKWLQNHIFGKSEPQQASNDKTLALNELHRKAHKEEIHLNKRGRITTSFKDCILKTDKEKVLKILKYVISGQKGKFVALIIKTCIKEGIIQKPTYQCVKKEFGDIGDRSGYNKYINDMYHFTDDEEMGAKKSIKQILE